MSNIDIKKNLEFRKNQALTILNTNPNLNPLFKSILYDLYVFDFENYQNTLIQNLRENLRLWISSTGYSKDLEPLDALVLKYDLFVSESESTPQINIFCYSISNWENKKVYTDKFDLGPNYSFNAQFFLPSDISLSFFDGLKGLTDKNRLDHLIESTSHETRFEVFENIEGFSALIQLHQYQGMLAIHEVLLQLEKNKEFEGLNYNPNFMFLIHRHGFRETFPLLILKKS